MAVRKGIYSKDSVVKIIVGIVLVFMFVFAASSNDLKYQTGQVLRVIDGDTLIVETPDNPNGISMRLAGIDAPETYNNSKAKKAILWCGINKEVMFSYGRITKNHLAQITLGKDIKYSVIDVGRFGRPIIYIPEITENLIRSGLVDVVDFRNLPKDIISRLHNLEIIAKQQKIGLWEHIDLSCMNNRGNM